MENNGSVDLQIKFQSSGIFSWVTLKSKTKNKAILEYNADPVTLLLQFEKESGFAKFFVSSELTKFKTVSINETFRSSGIYRNIYNSATIISTSS